MRTSASPILRFVTPFFRLLAVFFTCAALCQRTEGASSASELKTLRAGAATSNITPLLDVVLDGAIMKIGPATQIHDELFARCLVLDDGENRVAFVICDTTMISSKVVARAKELIRRHSGLPPERVVISATHTHSSPRALEMKVGAAHEAYNEFFVARVSDAVRRAIGNLAPAQVGWGSGQKPEFVENRRWFMTPGSIPPNPFGEKTDQVLMTGARPERTQPAGPVDPEVFVLSVRHADGRPLAVLANYGLHYVGGVPLTQVSADYYGVFADEVQRLLGADRRDPPFVAMMSNGTSGDVRTTSRRTKEKPEPPGREWAFPGMQTVGEGLAREVHRVISEIPHRANLKVSVAHSELSLSVRKPDSARLAWAEQMLAGVRDRSRLTRPQVYAQEAQYLAEYPATFSVPMQALRIGELAIVAIPCEVFAETGLAIKRRSPLKSTFTIELANGYHGYLPTPEQHALGGYETWPARSSHLEIQAEPKIRAEALRLLNEIAETRR